MSSEVYKEEKQNESEYSQKIPYHQEISKAVPSDQTVATDLASFNNTTSAQNHDELTEDNRIALMFKQQSEYWEKTMDQLAKVEDRSFSDVTPLVKPFHPPMDYVCPRCSKQADHWEPSCPTLDQDENEREKQEVLETPVPEQNSEDGVSRRFNSDITLARKWLSKQLEPIPDELRCSICSQFMRSAVMTPCCHASYCEACIRHKLVFPEHPYQELMCRSCGHQLMTDDLVADQRSREAVKDHVDSWIRKNPWIQKQWNFIKISSDRTDTPAAANLKDEIESGIIKIKLENTLSDENDSKIESVRVNGWREAIETNRGDAKEIMSEIKLEDSKTAQDFYRGPSPSPSEIVVNDYDTSKSNEVLDNGPLNYGRKLQQRHKPFRNPSRSLELSSHEGDPLSANCKDFSSGIVPTTSQSFGQINHNYYENTDGFAYEDLCYWENPEVYLPMDKSMGDRLVSLNQNSYDFPNHHLNGNYQQPQAPFMSNHRSTHNDFWESPQQKPQSSQNSHHQNDFHISGNVNGGFIYSQGGMRGNSYRGGFRGHVRGRGRPFGFSQTRPAFDNRRVSDHRRDDSVPVSSHDRSDDSNLESNPHQKKDRLVDDFGRDIPRRISENDVSIRKPSSVDESENKLKESRSKDRKHHSRSRSRRDTSKEKSRRSHSRYHRSSSRKHHSSRSPSRHGRSSDSRRRHCDRSPHGRYHSKEHKSCDLPQDSYQSDHTRGAGNHKFRDVQKEKRASINQSTEEQTGVVASLIEEQSIPSPSSSTQGNATQATKNQLTSSSPHDFVVSLTSPSASTDEQTNPLKTEQPSRPFEEVTAPTRPEDDNSVSVVDRDDASSTDDGDDGNVNKRDEKLVEHGTGHEDIHEVSQSRCNFDNKFDNENSHRSHNHRSSEHHRSSENDEHHHRSNHRRSSESERHHRSRQRRSSENNHRSSHHRSSEHDEYHRSSHHRSKSHHDRDSRRSGSKTRKHAPTSHHSKAEGAHRRHERSGSLHDQEDRKRHKTGEESHRR